MGLEKILALPNRENMGFYLASGMYLLTGLIDGLLTVKGLNLGMNLGITDWDWGHLARFFVDNYGIESGIAITKLNAVAAVMATEIVQRRAVSDFPKNIARKALYTGAALSGLGILGWMYSFHIIR